MASNKELALNAARWMEKFKQEREHPNGPKEVGAIFMMFNMDDPSGSAVCVGSVNKEGVKKACEGIIKKINRGQLIINPFEN